MKQSFFNYKAKGSDGKTLLFNAKTTALLRMDREARKAYNSFNKKSEGLQCKEEYVEKMIKTGVLIPDDLDELSEIRFRRLQSQFQTGSLGLTIAPTLDCNFRCIYCYEKKNISDCYMTEAIQEKIINLLESRIPIIKHLSITWYGGEPLLAMDIIKKLSSRINEICKNSNVHCETGIITNGYLLNEETAKQLKELEITFAQITLDGPREIHDKRRFTKEHKPTFDTIVDNIKKASRYIDRISVRINIDSTNQDKAMEMVEDLQKSGVFSEKVHPYLGFVDNINDCYNANLCLSYDKFAELRLNTEKDLIKNGLTKNIMTIYPKRINHVCCAEKDASFVIDPNGNLYKCWDDIGNPEMVIGSLDNDRQENISLLMDYMLYDPTKDNICKTCKLLPICMGGCPKKRIIKDPSRCSYMKYVLNQYLLAVEHEKTSENDGKEKVGK